MLRKYTIIILSAVLALLPVKLSAQAVADSVMTISGMVRDENRRLAFVNVSIRESTLGTVTNEDGYFSLKIPKTDGDITLFISHIGYSTYEKTMKASDAHELRIILQPYSNLLDAALVVEHDPEHLVYEALQRVRYNYSAKPISQRAFYRETARKGNRYISVSEAVMDLYKTGYHRSIEADRVGVLKGRRLMSQRSADTLAVKMQGGPNTSLSLDVVKNRSDLFYEEDLPNYEYKMEPSSVIEGRPVYVVSMKPYIRNDRYPLYNALVYIDKESLAIMRAEYSVDMSQPELVSGAILRKKPNGVKFDAIGVSFVSSYRLVGGMAVLQYVRGTIEFKCDWKKRLFSSPYTIVTEMVATDIKTHDVEQIGFKDSFRSFEIFYDKVDAFADPLFWENYNVLEPSESLEHAVDRLRRRLN